jgi:hypothetical protein
MYFLLHHSTGALMLAAEDRDQAVSWAGRKLGHSAKIASVVEWDENLSSDWVERTGTGLKQTLSIGCEAQLSFMADSVQRVNGFGSELIEIEEWYRTVDVSGGRVQVH